MGEEARPREEACMPKEMALPSESRMPRKPTVPAKSLPCRRVPERQCENARYPKYPNHRRMEHVRLPVPRIRYKGTSGRPSLFPTSS
jgi:hypothetical protein